MEIILTNFLILFGILDQEYPEMKYKKYKPSLKKIQKNL